MHNLRALIFKTAIFCAKLAVYLLLAGGCALVALRLWLGSSTGHTFVKKHLESCGIEIESVDITGFFPTRAAFKGMRLTSAIGEKSLQARSNHIELSLATSRLFLAEVVISELSFSDLRCVLAQRATPQMPEIKRAAQLSLPRLFPRVLSIDHLQIDDLEISGVGPQRSGQLAGNIALKTSMRTLCANAQIRPLADTSKSSLLPVKIDLTIDEQNAHLRGALDPEQWAQKNARFEDTQPLQLTGECQTRNLQRFFTGLDEDLPLDLALDWSATEHPDAELFGIASLGRCLPLSVKAQCQLMSRDRLDASISQIYVQSALGSAEGGGSIEGGQWRDCQLQMQVHRPIELPKPLRSIPASRGIARWSGPLDAPTVSYSLLPFGRSSEELAAEYKLQLERYRKDPAKWLFDLVLKDRAAPPLTSGKADRPPSKGQRQVAAGDLSIDWDQGLRIALSARGILPQLSPIEGCSLQGFFSASSCVHMPSEQQSSQAIKMGLQGQIGQLAFEQSLAENAHLSAEAQIPLPALRGQTDHRLFADFASQWQIFCTRGNWEGRRISALRAEAQQKGRDADFQVSARTIDWDWDNSSSIEDLSADGTLHIEPRTKSWSCTLRQAQAQVDGNFLQTALPMQLVGNEGGWELSDLHVKAGDGLLKVRVKAQDTMLAANLEASALPLSLANSLFDTELHGQINGQLNLLNQPGAPQLTGQLQTEGAAFFQNGEYRPLDGQLSVAMDRDNTRVCLSTSLFATPLLIEGHLPWLSIPSAPFFSLAAECPRDLTISLSGEIGPLTSLALPVGQRAQGHVEIALRSQSAGQSPALEGFVTLRDAEYVYEKARIHLRGISGQLAAHDGELRWNNITARDSGGGELSYSGRAALWPQFSLQSEVDLNKIAYTHADFVKGRISGAMQWSVDTAGNHLSGKLKLADAHVEIPDQLPVAMPLIAQGLRENREAAPPDHSALSLDIEIDIPPRVDIVGRGLSSQWGGWLHVGGSSSDAHLSGVLKLDKGIFTFGGKQFHIVDSHIYLGDEKRSEPSLQVTAEYPVDGATVRAILRGRLKSPELTFESYPQMSLNDMLSRVLFDTSFNTINPLQAIQVADAALSISGKRYAPIGQFKRNIKLDQISVQMPDRDAKKFVLQVGKYLKNGVLVGVKQSIDSEGSDVLVGTQISLEKRLRKHLTIKIEVGYQSESTFNLLWKRDY